MGYQESISQIVGINSKEEMLDLVNNIGLMNFNMYGFKPYAICHTNEDIFGDCYLTIKIPKGSWVLYLGGERWIQRELTVEIDCRDSKGNKITANDQKLIYIEDYLDSCNVDKDGKVIEIMDYYKITWDNDKAIIMEG